MSWVTVGVAVAGSLLSSSAKDDAWKGEARKTGQNRAQVTASKARAMALLPAQAKSIADAATAANVQSQKNEATALAEATVNAAAAGAKGGNVDQTLQSVGTNAARVQAQIAKSRRAGMLRINQEYEDILWDAENQTSQISVSGGSSTGRDIASAALSGLAAWAK